jgi:hypothetical protein
MKNFVNNYVRLASLILNTKSRAWMLSVAAYPLTPVRVNRLPSRWLLPVARRPLQVVRLPAASPSRVRQAA